MGLLSLPRLDTLLLNPLAFPRRPYHRLVKHYKDAGLLRQTRNDPLLDSQLAHDALASQYRELAKASPEALAVWHWLSSTATGDAFDEFFNLRRGRQRPTKEEGQEALRCYLSERACRTASEEAALQAKSNPWCQGHRPSQLEQHEHGPGSGTENLAISRTSPEHARNSPGSHKPARPN